MKLDFSLEIMEEIVKELYVLLEESLASSSESVSLSLEGHSDYLDIIAINESVIISIETVKYYDIYARYLEDDMDKLVDIIIDRLLASFEESTISSDSMSYEETLEGSINNLKTACSETYEDNFCDIIKEY